MNNTDYHKMTDTPFSMKQEDHIPLVVTSVAEHSQPFLAGFTQWAPPPPNTYSDGLPVFEIVGTDAQFVQIPLRPGRQVMCFAGAMAYMSDGIQLKVELGGLGKTFGRLAGGGSLFQATYTNESEQDGYSKYKNRMNERNQSARKKNVQSLTLTLSLQSHSRRTTPASLSPCT